MYLISVYQSLSPVSSGKLGICGYLRGTVHWRGSSAHFWWGATEFVVGCGTETLEAPSSHRDLPRAHDSTRHSAGKNKNGRKSDLCSGSIGGIIGPRVIIRERAPRFQASAARRQKEHRHGPTFPRQETADPSRIAHLDLEPAARGCARTRPADCRRHYNRLTGRAQARLCPPVRENPLRAGTTRSNGTGCRQVRRTTVAVLPQTQLQGRDRSHPRSGLGIC